MVLIIFIQISIYIYTFVQKTATKFSLFEWLISKLKLTFNYLLISRLNSVKMSSLEHWCQAFVFCSTDSSEVSPTIWSCYANLNHHYSFLHFTPFIVYKHRKICMAWLNCRAGFATVYRVYLKNLNKFENARNVAKRLKAWSFLIK